MDCLFCKIINGDIPSKKIYEDDTVYAFLDISPQASGHTLVVPKKHISTIEDATHEDMNQLFEVGKIITNKIMNHFDVSGSSYIINYGSRQEIKHLHLHLVPSPDLKVPIDEVYNKLKIED